MSAGELLWCFLQIGLMSFGGGYAVLPLIEERLVRGYGLLTLREFGDILTISQMTPGPLAVNASTFAGMRAAGLPGALAATTGCVASGFLLSLLLYRLFRSRRGGALGDALEGLRACSTGLIASAAGTILQLALWGGASALPEPRALLLFALSLLALRRWKLHPILLMLLTGCAGAALYLPISTG